MTGSVEPYFSNRTFSSPKPGQFLCQRLVWLNCLLSPTQEALPPNGLGFTSICLTRTQVTVENPSTSLFISWADGTKDGMVAIAAGMNPLSTTVKQLAIA